MSKNFGHIKPRTKPSKLQEVQMKAAIITLIDNLGGLSVASRLLGVKYYTLSGWRTRGRIPADAANEICRLDAVKSKGFTRENLRPDVICWWGD